MLATAHGSRATGLATTLAGVSSRMNGMRPLQSYKVSGLADVLVKHQLALLPRPGQARQGPRLEHQLPPRHLGAQRRRDLAHVGEEEVVRIHLEAVRVPELEQQPLEANREVHVRHPVLLESIKLRLLAEPQLQLGLRNDFAKILQQELVGPAWIGNEHPIPTQLSHLELVAIASNAVLLEGITDEDDLLPRVHATAIVGRAELGITGLQELSNLGIAVLEDR